MYVQQLLIMYPRLLIHYIRRNIGNAPICLVTPSGMSLLVPTPREVRYGTSSQEGPAITKNILLYIGTILVHAVRKFTKIEKYDIESR